MVASADLWVYNAENLCVSFFYQVTSIFHLRGGEIKKKFFLGLPTIYIHSIDRQQNQLKDVWLNLHAPSLQEGGQSRERQEE